MNVTLSVFRRLKSAFYCQLSMAEQSCYSVGKSHKNVPLNECESVCKSFALQTDNYSHRLRVFACVCV